MDEYISKEALRMWLSISNIGYDSSKGQLLVESCGKWADAINHMPTTDAVKVIRCKDCKYRNKINEEWVCNRLLEVDLDEIEYLFVEDNDFCKWGDRK